MQLYKHLFAILALLTGVIMATPLAAQQDIEGRYIVLKPAQPTQTGDKIEVVEVFWYGCPHCYSFEPFLEAWLKTKPEDVELLRVPGVLNQQWIPHARAYYTAEKLGIVDKVHRPLFDALHKEKKIVYTDEQLKDFFTVHGVSADEFTKTYNSPEVEAKIRQAYFLARDYKLTGVPSVVVNGKYLTSGSHAGTYEMLINVVNTLIARERQGAAVE
jgi:thiol:disulfide interchange protein DsbA